MDHSTSSQGLAASKFGGCNLQVAGYTSQVAIMMTIIIIIIIKVMIIIVIIVIITIIIIIIVIQ